MDIGGIDNMRTDSYYLINREALRKQTEGKFTEEQDKVFKDMAKEFERIVSGRKNNGPKKNMDMP